MRRVDVGSIFPAAFVWTASVQHLRIRVPIGRVAGCKRPLRVLLAAQDFNFPAMIFDESIPVQHAGRRRDARPADSGACTREIRA